MSKINVHHITPGRPDKNFGKAINQLIEHLPENDWVALRDIDTMPMHHRAFFGQCEQLAENNEADLIGCMTNRIGIKYQQHNGELSENYDIKHHIEIGHQRYKEHGCKLEHLDKVTIGGIFMLFSKKTWLKVGKFKEGGIQIDGSFIDWHFCKAVKDAGLRTAVAPGIYIFHLYREWVQVQRTRNARLAYEHLL